MGEATIVVDHGELGLVSGPGREYALDTEIDLGPEATKADLLRAIDGHILAGGELVGEHVRRPDQQRDYQ